MKRVGWSPRARAAAISLLAPAVLAGLSILLSFPLFSGEYTQHMGSIESAFISDARFVLENHPHLNWYPHWYLGFPFHLTYPPLLPYLTAVVSAVSGVSVAHSYRVLVAFAYVLCPVTFYFFAKRLMRSRLWALVCAVAYGFFPSSYYFYFPQAAQHLQGYPSVRLVNLSLYGEGPHTMGLAIAPLAGLFFCEAMEKPKPRNYVLAAVCVAAVALINLIAFFALAVILAVLLLVKLFGDKPLKAVLRALICLSLAYGLVAFTYDVSFVRASAAFGEQGISPWGWPRSIYRSWLAPLLLLTASIILARIIVTRGEAWAVAVTLVAALGGIISLCRFFGLAVAPQPWRYIPELDMGIALLIGLAARSLGRGRWPKRLLVTAVVVAATVNSALSWSAGWSIAQPNKDITDTAEYRVALHLEPLVSRGERVYATGSAVFWLNVFTDTPQVRGGSDQGATNPWWAHVAYQVNTGEEPDLSIQWLKALNVRYVVVDFPNASTAYKDYSHPFKFEGTLRKVFQWSGVAVYEIPISDSAWVQLVSSKAAGDLTTLQAFPGREGLADYLAMVEKSTANGAVDYDIENPDEIRVTVLGCSGEESLLVKSTFDPRWRAIVGGVDVPIEKIGPDFMLVQLNRTGSFDVHLVARPLLDQRLGEGISGATVIALFALIVLGVVRPSRAQRSMRASRTK